MAGGAQGGGGRPAVGGNLPQYQNMLQNYRQGAMGMPSQVPGANVAAPGGGMPQQYGMTKPAVMPQPLPMAPPQMSQPLPMAPQGQGMASAAVMPQDYGQFQPPNIAPQRPPMDPRMMQNPQMTPSLDMMQGPAPSMPRTVVPPRPPGNVGMGQPVGTPLPGKSVVPSLNRGMGQPVGTPLPGKSVVPPRPQIQGNPNATPISKALRPPGR